MKLMKRGLSILLSLCIFMTSLIIVSANEETGFKTIQNGNIQVIINEKNGGFIIKTIEGDKINKDDDNKDLLYRSGDFDTSFTSVRITEKGKESEEYIFGNDYSFLGLGGNNLTITQDDIGINAVWEVKDVKITQRLEPVTSPESEYHGLVNIRYEVENKRSAEIDVDIRILLDTALGSQDYAYYYIPNDNAPWTVIYSEQSLEGEDVPTYIEANDSEGMYKMTGYSVLEAEPDTKKPYKVTFAHWNNLASTIFDYTPNEDLAFISAINTGYRTADSAAAYYYDAGSIASDGKAQVDTYYGVRSRAGFNQSEETVDITVNIPSSLELNEEKTSYISPDGGNEGTFKVSTNLLNTRANYPHAILAVYTDNGIVPLDEYGNELTYKPTRENPSQINIYNLGAGAANSVNYDWNFRADVDLRTQMRRIEFRLYNMNNADGFLLEENLIGSSTVYILCPGGNGETEKVTFTSLSPEVVYLNGTRRLYVTGGGFDFLETKAGYSVRLINTANSDIYYDVPMENLYFESTTNMEIILDMEMEKGAYKIVFLCEPSLVMAGIGPELTAPCLTFNVNDDPNYRNDAYGILAVFRKEADRESDIEYFVKLYEDEDSYTDHFEENLLFEIKGFFAKEAIDDNTNIYTSVLSGKHNTAVINQSLDFTKGTITITEKKGKNGFVKIKMDGKLTTNKEGTFVSEGEIEITQLTNGELFELVRYDEFGERVDMGYSAQPIVLTWASDFLGYSMFDGFPVQIRDAVFGAIHKRSESDHEDVGDLDGYTVSFGGEMNLRFLVPGEQPLGLEAKDVVFGRNDGFLGVNAEGSVVIPGFAKPIGGLAGTFSANTINDHYTVGVNGTLELVKMFEAQFDLVVKKGDEAPAPIPDRLGVYLRNFRPGQPIGPPLLFLTGGGGGYDKLYDTIYMKGAIPPLTLDVMAQVSLLQIARAEGAFKISLGGFGAGVGPMTLEAIPIVWGPAGEIAFGWYPDLYLYKRQEIDLLVGIIRGSLQVGIGEVNDRFLAEVYINAFIKLPTEFLFGSDIDLAEAGLGVSTERLWGVARILGIGIGAAYYWGDNDLDLTTKDLDRFKPEFKSMFDSFEIPVYYDEENDRVLMMDFGSNLMDVSSAGYMGTTGIESDDKKTHTMKLGADSTGGVIVKIAFDEEVDEAWVKENVKLTKGGVNYFENAVFAQGDEKGERNLSDANAVMSTKEGKTTLVTSIAPEDIVLGEWILETGKEAEVSLTVAEPLPQISGINASLNNNEVTVNYTGSLLDETKVTFYVSEDEESAGTYIGEAINPTVLTNTFTLPSDLPTGEYYVYATAQNNDSYSRVVTDTKISFVNPKTPAKPDAVILENVGNEYFEATVTAEEADGYYINVYEKDEAGNLVITDYANLLYEKDDELLIGGNYTSAEGLVEGITGGKKYIAGVSVFKILDDGSILISEETLSEETYLNEYTPPVIEFEGEKLYNTNEVSFTLKSNETVTAKLLINDEEIQTVAGDSVTIERTLSDGEHLIRFKGEDAEGNGFEFLHMIEIDTIAPTLLVENPLNGSMFNEDGTVNVQALTEKGTLFTITSDGEVLIDKANLDDKIDAEGRLKIENLDIGKGKDTREVEIVAEDAAGNKTVYSVRLKNKALGNMKGIKLVCEDAVDKKIPLNETGTTTAALKLYGETDEGLFEITDTKTAALSVTTIKGEARIDENNNLIVSYDAVGFAEGVLAVGEKSFVTDYLAFGEMNEQDDKVRVFFMNGDEIHQELIADNEGKVDLSLVAEPFRPGYNFVGWALDEEGEVEVNENTVFLADSSCYAVWEISNELPFEAKEGAISIRYNGNGIDISGEFVRNDKYTGLAVPAEGDMVTVVVTYMRGEVPYMVTATGIAVKDGKIEIEGQKLSSERLDGAVVAGISVLWGVTPLEAVTAGDLGTPVAVYKP